MRRNMRAERARLGLTQKQVAEELGVSTVAVSGWEQDKATPNVENIISLCKLYGCSVEYLLDMTDVRNVAAI